MKFRWLKQIMPRGLHGRAALILILPVVTIQLVVSVVFIQRHFERVTEQMSATMVREVRLAEALMLGRIAPPEGQDTAGQRAAGQSAIPRALGLHLALPAPAPLLVRRGDARDALDFTGSVVAASLREGLSNLRFVDLTGTPGVQLVLDTPEGPLMVAFPRDRVSASNPHQLLVPMVFVSVLMTLIAYLFLRNQLRPIERLALAAEEFGRGRVVPYTVRGATEVRKAGMAFLDMRSRIERHIEQRTLMLSGVSHDLRTPLTRLKLGLSMLPEGPEVAALARDVDEMNRLVDAFLDFARAGAEAGEVELRDLSRFVQEVVEDARRAGLAVSLSAPPGEGLARFRPAAIRRALDNLIGNAVRYGLRAQVSVALSETAVRIAVEDAGPGIPPERREEALRPFTRLDPARNQDRGQGVGLGLSIALDIVRGHGGTLLLGRSETLGGLKAEIVLPR